MCDFDNFCSYLSDPENQRTINGNGGDCSDASTLYSICFPPCPENVALTSQDEVNEFGATYAHCTTIDGNFTISGSDISDLTPLSTLESIGGILEISYNGSLADLSRLGSLESIGGDFIVRLNPY